MKSFEELWLELSTKAIERPEGSGTIAALDAGVHSIGKKILEEAGEVWLAAEHETDEAVAEAAAKPARELCAGETAERRPECPPALRDGLVAGIAGPRELVRPWNHPFAGRPRADHGDRAQQDAHKGEADEARLKQLAQRRDRGLRCNARGHPFGRFRQHHHHEDAEQRGDARKLKHPAPGIRRDGPEPRKLREQKDARIESRHHGSGNQGA